MRAVYRHPNFGHFRALATTRARGVGTVCSRMRQRARNETKLKQKQPPSTARKYLQAPDSY